MATGWQHILQTTVKNSRRLAQTIATQSARVATDLLDADNALIRSMDALIAVADRRYTLASDSQLTGWRPGAPLKLLMVGYSGTRNTGADVRVEEMVRQFRHLFGDAHLSLSITTMDPALTRGYFKTVRQLQLPDVFPRFVFEQVAKHHGVVTCEGSMFKSKFANALSTLMAGALGMATAEHKLAIGYGGEAGEMDAPLRSFVGRRCKDAWIIARNRESIDVLGALGVSAELGTDTAWTFEPAPDSTGQALLADAGWDGQAPILAICPINPFWWPVRADLKKGLERMAMGLHKREHYKSVYFHHGGAEVEAKQDAYLAAIAEAIEAHRAKHPDLFVILVGMEQLDRRACEALNPKLSAPAPLFISDTYDMFQMVSVIRQATALVSSRYHAIVTSMPGGVASAGITMDERIRNLMADRATPELALEVDDPDLAASLAATLETLFDADRGDAIRAGIDRCVVTNLERMGQMGVMLVDHVKAAHPEFPFAEALGSAGGSDNRGDGSENRRSGDRVWRHLPPLSDALKAKVDRVLAARQAQAGATQGPMAGEAS